ncbi:MAG: hypothetical protein IJ849_09840 [Selenomonadaceae bacterium]|nr:hypothetical protein [Selenomonadaceae bacterium]
MNKLKIIFSSVMFLIILLQSTTYANKPVKDFFDAEQAHESINQIMHQDGYQLTISPLSYQGKNKYDMDIYISHTSTGKNDIIFYTQGNKLDSVRILKKHNERESVQVEFGILFYIGLTEKDIWNMMDSKVKAIDSFTKTVYVERAFCKNINKEIIIINTVTIDGGDEIIGAE